jgi:hypothetical protein
MDQGIDWRFILIETFSNEMSHLVWICGILCGVVKIRAPKRQGIS